MLPNIHIFALARALANSDNCLMDLQSGTKLGEVYYLVTNPDLSGPSPTRPPPGKGSVGTTTPLALTYKSSFSLQSTPSRRLDGYDDIDEFEDDDELPQKSNRALNDISDFVLDLPPFATGNLAHISCCFPLMTQKPTCICTARDKYIRCVHLNRMICLSIIFDLDLYCKSLMC